MRWVHETIDEDASQLGTEIITIRKLCVYYNAQNSMKTDMRIRDQLWGATSVCHAYPSPKKIAARQVPGCVSQSQLDVRFSLVLRVRR